MTTVFRWAVVVAAGVAAGVGAFALVYARAPSYLSNDPTACVNCHVMRDNYDAWSVSSHRDATCNDCHVPHDLLGKYVTKAENGYHHSYAFTFKDVQVIRARPVSTAIVDANCRRCHEAETAMVRVNEGPTPLACVRCHRGAGHVF